jgi:hypothetical protein
LLRVCFLFDRGSPQALTGTTTVSISVINVNDDPPTFSQDRVTITVKEERPSATSLYNMTARDGDEDAQLLYSPVWPASTGYKDNVNVSLHILQVFTRETFYALMDTTVMILMMMM